MAGPYDLWRNDYDVPGPQDPRRQDEIRASGAPRWEELLPGSMVSTVKQNPVTQFLERYLNRPAADPSQHYISPIDGTIQRVDVQPGAMDRLPATVQEGIGGLGLLSMFLGPGAKTANLPALAKAKSMTGSGAPREAVWNETGWFQGPDKKWRFEIDDSAAGVQRSVADDFAARSYGDQVPVRNADRFLDHPTLFEAYPDFWRVNTRINKVDDLPSASYAVRESGTENATINAKTIPQARSMALHEYQHAIQQREGFAQGADVSRGIDVYNRAGGEVEARTVQRRQDMTPDQRRARAPWLDYDVAEKDQIVRMLMGGGQ